MEMIREALSWAVYGYYAVLLQHFLLIKITLHPQRG